MSGWDDLDVQVADIREPSQKQKDMDRLVLRVLGGEDGDKLLQWLISVYVDVPVAVPGSDPSHAFFAEGQRNVVRDLLHRIKRAKEM